MNETKKLYRVEVGAKLAGVCGGIGEFFNLDPNILRLICAVPAGALTYAVCIVVSGEGRAEMQAILHKLHR